MRKRCFLSFTALLAMLLLWGCRTIQYVPIKQTEYVTVRDSVYLRDTTIKYKVETEYVKDYSDLLDTLELSTGLAEAKAWVDTSKSVLAGEIKNKQKSIDIPVQVKEKVVVRDSIVYKEKPVPVEVEKVVHPKYEAGLWAWVVFSLLGLGLFIYFRYIAARKFM